MENLFLLYSEIIGYGEKLLAPIVLLVISFLINVFYRYKNIESEEYVVNVIEFKRRFWTAHGLACIFSLVYALLKIYLKGTSVELIVVIIFYVFLLWILIIQNKDSCGYIESLEGASGAIMYISASLEPGIFVVLYSAFIFYIYLYNKNGDKERKMCVWKLVIDLSETIISLIIATIITPSTFLGVLWINVVAISVFTLLLPLLNERILLVLINKLDNNNVDV